MAALVNNHHGNRFFFLIIEIHGGVWQLITQLTREGTMAAKHTLCRVGLSGDDHLNIPDGSTLLKKSEGQLLKLFHQ